jgi:hypothetical protein
MPKFLSHIQKMLKPRTDKADLELTALDDDALAQQHDKWRRLDEGAVAQVSDGFGRILQAGSLFLFVGMMAWVPMLAAGAIAMGAFLAVGFAACEFGNYADKQVDRLQSEIERRALAKGMQAPSSAPSAGAFAQTPSLTQAFSSGQPRNAAKETVRVNPAAPSLAAAA